MRRSQTNLGTIGLATLFFGGVAYAITQDVGFFVVANVLFGIFALIAYVASARDSFGTFLGERSTKFGAHAALYSVLFIGILVMINFLAARHFRRFDTTEAGVYSLSPESTQYVKGLSQELDLMAFVETGKDPAIEELFKSYAQESSHVKYQMVDPDKSPDLAQRYNITTYGTIRVAYGDQSTLVSKGDEEAITNAILKVMHSTKKTICLVEGHGEPDFGDTDNPKAYGGLRTALESENYNVKAVLLATQEKVPDECDLLLVPAPQKAYLEPEIKLVKEHLSGGGRAVFLLAARRGPELTPLLADYGIRVGNDIVVDQVLRLFQGPALGVEPIADKYGQHPITEGFTQRTIFPFTRSVDAATDKKAGVDVTPIVKTGASSWAETDLDGLFKGKATFDAKADRKGPISIAVAASVTTKQGDKDVSSRLVAFGSDEFVDNKFLNNLYNRDLMLNAVNWAVGEDKQITIRTRSVRASRVQLTSDQVTRIFYLSVLIVPELLLLLGISVWSRRRTL
ncbi:MAG TPA: Gldg family protein [Candidatus Binatia bacterium]|nr:Gldg family protein [Candidatus Binatia bacterium]